MCGIFFLKQKKRFTKEQVQKFKFAVKKQSYRGPDANNSKIFDNFAMGFNYLQITSNEDAIQPFLYKNTLLLFNGEIYNFLYIKKKLLKVGHYFKTDGDTEVLAASLEEFGLKKTLKIIRGMFSFISYNLKTKTFFIARDRLGIKPLFYFKDKNKFIFSSSIKSIRVFLNQKLEIKKQTMMNYINSGNLDLKNDSFFKNIKIFPAGEYIKFKKSFSKKNVKKYWSLKTNDNSNFSKLSIVKKELDKTFKIHKYKKKSGLAFSNGIDSNIIASHYNDLLKVSLVGNETIEDYNLKKIAKKKKTIPLYYKKNKFFKLFKEFSSKMDQPVRSSHWIFQYGLRKYLNKRNIRVIYTGDGSDEVFGGYAYAFQYLLNEKNFNIDNKKKFSNLLKDGLNVKKLNKKYSLKEYLKSRLINTHLPYWLRTEDEISMLNSIENRVPFLDHVLIDKAFNIKSSIFYHNGQTKYILKKIYKDKLSQNVLSQRKIGRPGYKINHFLLFNKLKKNIFKSQIIKKVLSKNNKLRSQMLNLNNSDIKNDTKMDILFRFVFIYFWFNKKVHKYNG
jgi:asparagine synthase (glutamine-hydrolysing)